VVRVSHTNDPRELAKLLMKLCEKTGRRLSAPFQGTHLRRDTVIPQGFQASKAAAASDGHAVHC
jgi:hypothetical protein